MNNLVKINNRDLLIKEFKDQRVVTFEDIDKVHERPGGTAKRNFAENRKRFLEEVDYFITLLRKWTSITRCFGLKVDRR